MLRQACGFSFTKVTFSKLLPSEVSGLRQSLSKSFTVGERWNKGEFPEELKPVWEQSPPLYSGVIHSITTRERVCMCVCMCTCTINYTAMWQSKPWYVCELIWEQTPDKPNFLCMSALCSTTNVHLQLYWLSEIVCNFNQKNKITCCYVTSSLLCL